MNQNLISLENVGKFFSQRKILRDINLQISKGEILWLRGVNGSGKSTLLKILAGLMEQDFGKRQEAKGLKIAFQGHDLGLYLHLTVQENLEFFLPLVERNSQLTKILEDWSLQELANQTVADLSKGQMARAALAITFATATDLLLLDEPNANLDSAAAALLASNLKLFVRDNPQASVIVAAHEAGFLLDLPIRRLTINQGLIEDNEEAVKL